MATRATTKIPAHVHDLDYEAIFWEINIPLVNNRYMLRDMGILLGISYAVMLLIFIAILGFGGNLDDLPKLLPWLGIVGLFLLVLLLFTMGVVMRNRVKTAFLINCHGIDSATTDRWINFLLKASVVAGAAAKNPTIAGSGLIALSRKRVAYPWKKIDRIEVDKKRRILLLKDTWHVVQRVYCPIASWEAIMALVSHFFHGPILYRS